MLNDNAFFLLAVSPRDNKEAIAEAFDEKAADGEYDEALLHQAQKTLMASKTRLEAELAWFLDVAPKRVKQITENIKNDSKQNNSDFFKGLLSELNGISKANLAAYVCGQRKGTIEFLEALIAAQSEISLATIKADINSNRNVAGFPEVDDTLVNQQLDKQRQIWAEAAIQQISLSEHPGNYMTALLEKFSEGDLSSKKLLDDLMGRYENFIIPKLRNHEDAVNSLIEKIREKEGKNSADLVAEIIKELKLWDEYAQPSQLVYSAKGLDEPRSKKIFELVRDFAIWLANEAAEHKLSLDLTLAAKDIFAELPSVSHRIAEDIGTLEELVEEGQTQEAVAPLMSIVLEIFQSEVVFVKNLKKHDFSASAPGTAGELFRTFEKIVSETRGTSFSEVPWLILKKLSIHLNNERDNPEVANKILVAMAAMSPPENMKEEISKDLHTMQENIWGKELKEAIASKNVARAKIVLNNLIQIADNPQDKAQWQGVLTAIQKKSRSNLFGWVFWIGVLIFIAMLDECDGGSTKTSSYTPPKSNYSAPATNYQSPNTYSQYDTPSATPPAYDYNPTPNPAPTVAPTAKASFPCSSATSTLEILICSDTELAGLDGKVGETYNYLREITADYEQARAKLLEQQRSFLKERLEVCKIPYQKTLSEYESQSLISCLKRQYSVRLATLQGYITEINNKLAETDNSDSVSPEIKNTVSAAVRKFIDTQSSTGATGVVVFNDNCFSDTAASENQLVYCMAFDAIASALIPLIEEENKFPRTPQFEKAMYNARARNRLKAAGITDYQEQTNILNGISHEAGRAFGTITAEMESAGQ